MSIPTRFTVYGPGMLIQRNKSLGTFSYGTDTSDKNVWLDYFKQLNDPEIAGQTYNSWFSLEFDSIVVDNTPFSFTKEEITK